MNPPFEIDLQTGNLTFPNVPLNLAPKQSVNVILATNPGVFSNRIASTADGSAIVCDTIWRMARYSESHSFSAMLASGKSGSIIVPRSRVTGRVSLRRKNLIEQKHFDRKSPVNSGDVGAFLGVSPTRDTMTNPHLQSYSSPMADGSSKTPNPQGIAKSNKPVFKCIRMHCGRLNVMNGCIFPRGRRAQPAACRAVYFVTSNRRTKRCAASVPYASSQYAPIWDFLILFTSASVRAKVVASC